MTYADFLKALLALGPKLATAWPIIVALWNNLMQLGTILHGEQQPAPGAVALGNSEEETALEGQVLQLMRQSGTVQTMSNDRLKSVWQWFQAHPQVMSLLVSLLTGALKVGLPAAASK